jgi:hypothetical protein
MLAGAEGGTIAKLLDGFGYNVMRQNQSLVHPNEILVLSPGFKWSAMLTGTLTASALRDAGAQASRFDSPGTVDAILRRAADPETWVVLGALGLVVTLMVMLLAVWRRPAVGR